MPLESVESRDQTVGNPVGSIDFNESWPVCLWKKNLITSIRDPEAKKDQSNWASLAI